jgi:hypothetical protein
MRTNTDQTLTAGFGAGRMTSHAGASWQQGATVSMSTSYLGAIRCIVSKDNLRPPKVSRE